MSEDQLLEWAAKMGYPGVDSTEFRENVRRLLIPQTKQTWRRLIECVRPADEVSKMKKQLLCYKLSIEENPTKENLEKFDNVTEYECFLKKRILAEKIENLNHQIEQKKKQIEFTCVKNLKDSEERKRTDEALEKEKAEKLRLLRLKKAEIYDDVMQYKDSQSLTEDIMKPTYGSSHQDAELSQFISSLEPGYEVEQMCSHLTSKISEMTEFIQSERRSSTTSLTDENISLHLALAGHASQLFGTVLELRNRRNKLREELDQKRREFSRPDLDLADRLKASYIQSGRLDALIASEEQKFLKSWILSNAVPIVEDPSSISVSNVDVEHSLSQALSDLRYYNSFPASRLRSSLVEYVKKTRTVAAKSPNRDFGIESERILSGLTTLIENFLKTPNIMSKSTSSDAISRAVQDYNNSKSAQFQKLLTTKFPQLHLALRYNFPEPLALLYSIESSVTRQKNKVNELFSEIQTLFRQLDDNFLSILSHLNNGSKHALRAVLPGAFEFHDSIEKIKVIWSCLNPEERLRIFEEFEIPTLNHFSHC